MGEWVGLGGGGEGVRKATDTVCFVSAWLGMSGWVVWGSGGGIRKATDTLFALSVLGWGWVGEWVMGVEGISEKPLTHCLLCQCLVGDGWLDCIGGVEGV